MVTLTGSNDPATFSGASSAGVTEDSGTYTTGGTLIVADVDSATTVVVQTNTAGTYGAFSIDAAGAWSYTADNAKLQALGGTTATATDTFAVTTADGTTHNIVVTLTGSNDPATFSGASSAGVTEDSGTYTTGGTLIVADVDSATTVVAQPETAGSYGIFSIGTNGVWSYTADNAKLQALGGTTATATDTFAVTTADGTTHNIVVTLTGVNDAAVISGTSSGAVIEAGGVSNATVGTSAATGTLTDTDVDNPANSFIAVTTAAASTGGFGTYTMTAGGVWTYTLNNTNATVQALNVGQSLTDTFTVTSADGTKQQLTVTIHGANDAAVIGGTSTGSVTEAGGVANDTAGTPTATGTLTTADVDGTAGAAAFTAADSGTPSDLGYGTYALSAGGVWTYTLNDANETVQALNVGGTLTDHFTATTPDGATQVVTVTIHGVNDAAVIGGDTVKDVVEGELASDISTSGTLTSADVDGTANLFIAQTAVDGSNGYGTFSIDDAGAWIYTANSAHNEFAAGVTYTDSFTVQAADGTAQEITVNIQGRNVASFSMLRAPSEAVTGLTVVEGQQMDFVVTREFAGDAAAVDIAYQLVAVPGGDTSLPATRSGTLYFAAGATTAHIFVDTVDDELVNADQTFVVAITAATDSNSGEAVSVFGATTVGTIQSNDAEIGISSLAVDAAHSSAGRVAYTLTLYRDGATKDFSHTVDFVIKGAGQNPADPAGFVFPDGQAVTFAADEISKVVSFTAPAGLMSDGVRGFDVQLIEHGASSAGENADLTVVLGIDAAHGDIMPDGVDVSVVALSTKTIEGTGIDHLVPQTFQIQLAQPASAAVTVHWSVAPYSDASVSAQANDFLDAGTQQPFADGTYPSGDVTFAVGETSQTITITPNPDSSVESTERFNVNIAVTSGPAGVAIGTAVGQIVNDDAALALSSPVYVADEGSAAAGGTLTATITREGFARSSVTGSWQVELISGDPASGKVNAVAADFAGGVLPSGSFEMVAGQMTLPVQIHLVGNSALELGKDFRIVLVDVVGGTQIDSAHSSAVATIVNDDMVFSIQSVSVNTAANGATSGSSVTTDLGADPSAIASVAEGQAGATTYVTYTALRTGDIRNAATVVYSLAGNGSAPATIGAASGASTDVVTPSNTVVTFAAGASTATFTVAVKGDDVLEANEQFTATLTGVGNSANSSINASHASATVSIANDDSVIAFAADALNPALAAAALAKENDGVFSYTLTRTGDVSRELNVGWLLDAPATSGTSGVATQNDFSALSGTAHFGIGDATATFTVLVAADNKVEPDESFTLRLVAPAVAQGVTLGTLASAAGTLQNDDVSITVAPGTMAASEGAAATIGDYSFTLHRTGDTAQTSTVSWWVAGAALTNQQSSIVAPALESSDFSGDTRGSVTWAAGDGNDKTITVHVMGNDIAQGDRAFQLTVVADPATAAHNDVQANGYYGVVKDDDAQLAISAASASVVEGKAGATQTVIFTITRSGDLSSMVEADVVFDAANSANHIALGALDSHYCVVASAPLTPAVGTGSTPATSGVLAHVRFAPESQTVTVTTAGGQTQTVQFFGGTQTATLSLTLTGDDVLEAGETLKLALANKQVTDTSGHAVAIDSSNATASTVIANDDVVYTTATTSGATIYEGEPTNVPNDPAHAALLGNAADPFYTFTVTLAGPAIPSTPVQWRIVGNGEMQVNADDFMAGQSSVNVANAGLPSGLLNMDPLAWTQIGDSNGNHQWTQAVTVRLSSDSTIEADEGFRLALSASSGNAEMRDSASAVLVGDDFGVNVVPRQSVVVEGNPGDAQQYLTYDLVRAGDTGSAYSLYWKIDLSASGGITAGDLALDYAHLPVGMTYDDVNHVLSGKMDFAAGESGKALELPLLSDAINETDKTATLALFSDAAFSSPLQQIVDGSPVGNLTAAITLKDDDVSLSVAALAGDQTEGSTAGGFQEYTFTVTRQGNDFQLNQATTVHWHVVGDNVADTALGVTASDFSAGQDSLGTNAALPSGSITFAATTYNPDGSVAIAGETSKTITINVAQDSLKELDEILKVQLTDASAGATIVTAQATGTIRNDDALVSFAAPTTDGMATDLDKPEGDGVISYGTGGPTFSPAPATPYTFTLTRTGNLDQTSIVNWSVAPAAGSAGGGLNAGDFYLASSLPSGTVTFNPDDATATISINIAADTGVPGQTVIGNRSWVGDIRYYPYDYNYGANPSSTLEGNESFTVSLTSATDPITSAPYTGTEVNATPQAAVIRNDDVKIQVTDLASNRPEGRPETQYTEGILQSVTLARQGDPTQQVSLQWFLDRASTNESAANQVAQILYNHHAVSATESTPGDDTHKEVQSFTPTLVAHDVNTLSVGGVTLTSVATLDTTPTVAELISNLTSGANADTYARAAFTLSDGGDGHLLVNWKANGIINDVATLTVSESASVMDQAAVTQHGVADTVVDGEITVPGTDEIQTLIPSEFVANSLHTLKVGSTVLTTNAYLSSTPLLDQLVATFQEMSGGAPFNVAANADHTAMVLTWKATGEVTEQAMLTSLPMSGVLTWAENNSAGQTISIRPFADNFVEADTTVPLYIRPIGDSAQYIDEIGFDKNSNAVYAVPFDPANWTKIAESLPIANFVIKRDESGIWVSNEMQVGYNSNTSMDNGYVQADFTGYNSWWGGVGDIYYNSTATTANLEGSMSAAVAGSDYTAANGTLTFTDSARTQTITVAIGNNSVYETTEAFSVFLENAHNASVIVDHSKVIINDNDTALADQVYAIKVQGSTGIEGIDTNVGFTVDFGKALTQATEFTVELQGITAQQQDYYDGTAGDFSRYFNYSTDGGQTWHTNAPVFDFTVSTDNAAQSVDDQLVASYSFYNGEGAGPSFDHWLDFSDLQAGSTLKVGGQTSALANDWHVTTDAITGIKTATVWIPVRVDAVIDTNALGMSFAGMAGQISGHYVGTADLQSDSAINVAALGYLSSQGILPGPQVSGIENLQYTTYAYTGQTLSDFANPGSALSSGTASDINFQWDAGDILNSGRADSVLVHFTGSINVPGDGSERTVQFYSSNDDGFYFSLNGQTVINSWSDQGASIDPYNGDGSITVSGGQSYTFDAWYYEAAEAATAELLWDVGNGTVPVPAYVGAGDLAPLAQDHFHSFDPTGGAADVKFLQFDVSWDPTSIVGDNPTWAITGLDPSLVVAPQDGGSDQAWTDLQIVQDVSVAHGSTSVDASIALGAQAHFDNNHQIQQVGVDNPLALAPSFSYVDSPVDPLTGLRTVTVTVTRGDGDVTHNAALPGDVVNYNFNLTGLEASMLTHDSASLHGTVDFAAGSASQTLTFEFAAVEIPPPPREGDAVSAVANPVIHVVVENTPDQGYEQFWGDRPMAFVDNNADGIHQAWETQVAFYYAEGSFEPAKDQVDLANNSVVVHFNGTPGVALDFSGFGADDRIEIDRTAFVANGWKGGYITNNNHGFDRSFDCNQMTGATSRNEVWGTTGQNHTNWHLSASGTRDTCNGRWTQNEFQVRGSVGHMSHYSSPRSQWIAGTPGYYTPNTGSHWSTSAQANVPNTGSTWVSGASGHYTVTGYNSGSRMQWSSVTQKLADFGTGDHVNGIINGEGQLNAQVDFVTSTVQVVVERDGAWIDTNANGVHDGNENVQAFDSGEGGSGTDLVDVAHNSVVIHFNDVPYTQLNLTGFGADDKIEIDVAAIHDNGGYMGSAARTGSRQNNWSSTSSGSYGSSIRQYGSHGSRIQVRASRCSSTNSGRTWECNNLTLYTRSSDRSHTYRDLATFGQGSNATHANLIVDGKGGVMDHVSFVDNTIHVVVERDGAYVDSNANGVHDRGEDTLAFDQYMEVATDRVDLAHNKVVVHFNDAPSGFTWALDFSGFGADDRIEIDRAAFASNGWAGADADQIHRSVSTSDSSSTRFSSVGFHNASGNSQFRVTAGRNTDGWNALSVQGSSQNSSHWEGLAYFGDYSSNQIIDAQGGLMNRVSFVSSDLPIHVVVDASGAFIDRNDNGVLDAGETQKAFDLVDGHAVDLVGLADHKVVVHFNDAPLDALNFAGFGADDKIEIDRTAFMLNGWKGGTVSRAGRNTWTSSNSGRVTHAYSGKHKSGGTAQGNTNWYLGVEGSRRSTSSDSGSKSWVGNKLSAYGKHNSTGGSSWALKPLAEFGTGFHANLILDGKGHLMDQVTFVTSAIHVVVDADGAWVDSNADGFHQSSEDVLAFGSDGTDNIDLAHNAVTVRFQDAPVHETQVLDIGTAVVQEYTLTWGGFSMSATTNSWWVQVYGGYAIAVAFWDHPDAQNAPFQVDYNWNTGELMVTSRSAGDVAGLATLAHADTTVEATVVSDGNSLSVLDFVGFGSDDKIEIDIGALQANHWPQGAGTHAQQYGDNSGPMNGASSYKSTRTNNFHYEAYASRGNTTGNGGWDCNYLSLYAGSKSGHSNREAKLVTFGESSAQHQSLLIDGRGGLMDHISFIDTTVHVGVDAVGAWLDANADGVRQATEVNASFGEGGNVSLALERVVIHFNDAPVDGNGNAAPLDFSGFDLNDRIEIDREAFAANGWAGALAGNVTHNDWRSSDSSTYASSKGRTDSYRCSGFQLQARRTTNNNQVNHLSLHAWKGTQCSPASGWRETGNKTLRLAEFSKPYTRTYTSNGFDCHSYHAGNDMIDAAGGLLARVDFVNAPTIHVVVDQGNLFNGAGEVLAYVDDNADGIHQSGETTVAFDCSEGSWQSRDLIDLAHNKVVIHFNGAPDTPLDFSGFGKDDRIEIDRAAFADNGWSHALDGQNATHSVSNNSRNSNHASGKGYTTNRGDTGFKVTAQRSSGSTNRLRAQSGTYSSGGGSTLAVFGNYQYNQIIDGKGGLMGQVSYVETMPVVVPPQPYLRVVVDASGAWVDDNKDGLHQDTEATLAFDPDRLGLDLVGLATNHVTVRFNDVPATPLDFSGFGADDKIEINRYPLLLDGWAAALVGSQTTQMGSIKGYFAGSTFPPATAFAVGSSQSENLLMLGSRLDGASHRVELARFGTANTLLDGNGGLMAKVSFVTPTFVDTPVDANSFGLSQNGTGSSHGSTNPGNTITAGTGSTGILINTPITNDTINETTETLATTVTQTGDTGNTFVVPSSSATATIVDNDSPQIAVGATTGHDRQTGNTYLFQTIDINQRNIWAGTPNPLDAGTSMNGDGSYSTSGTSDTYTNGVIDQNGGVGSSTISTDAGAGRGFMLTLTYHGNWEFALVDESLGMHQGPSGYQTLVADHTDAQGNSIAYVDVSTGTQQVRLRAPISPTDADSGPTTDLLSRVPMSVVVSHVDPVLVAREVSVNEADGTVTVQVIAVGGDLTTPATVDYSTVDGTWVDRTFIFSREFATVGVQTANWTVSALNTSPEGISGQPYRGMLVDGNGWASYVNGYFGNTSISTVTPSDFAIVGNQVANASSDALFAGMPSGTVTFAEGQKEVAVTVRVRADSVGEQIEDFAVVLTMANDGAEKLANPQAPVTYAAYGYAGYARIQNDDQVFSLVGNVFNEAISSRAYTDGEGGQPMLSSADGYGLAHPGAALDASGNAIVAPDGTTLHQFIIHRDGDSRAAATVDWVLQVRSDSGLTHQAGEADFAATGSSALYGVAWQAGTSVDANGHSVSTSVARTVTFAAGQSDAVVTFAVANDALAEDAEQFNVQLVNPQALPGNEGVPGVSATQGSASFVIGDNDGSAVSVAISGTPDTAATVDTVTEGTAEASPHQVVLTFTRSNAESAPASQAYFDMQVAQVLNSNDNYLTLDAASAGHASLIYSYTSSWNNNQGASVYWHGVVDFAAGASTATVTFNIVGDNFVEPNLPINVTLYDAEHLPQGGNFYPWGWGWGGNVTDQVGIGSMTQMPDWSTTHRDAVNYTDSFTLTNDDVRLWLGGFSDTRNNWNSNYHYRDVLAVAGYEGDSTYPTVASGDNPTYVTGGQNASGLTANGNGGVTLDFVRAGSQVSDVTLHWEVVLNGTASESDFNAGAFTSSYVLDGITHLVGSSTVTLAGDGTTTFTTGTHVSASLNNIFAADRTLENNETFSLNFTSDDAKVKFTYDWIGESNSNSGNADRQGTASITVHGTIQNDDPVYSIQAVDSSVKEADAGNQTFFNYNVTRDVDLHYQHYEDAPFTISYTSVVGVQVLTLTWKASGDVTDAATISVNGGAAVSATTFLNGTADVVGTPGLDEVRHFVLGSLTAGASYSLSFAGQTWDATLPALSSGSNYNPQVWDLAAALTANQGYAGSSTVNWRVVPTGADAAHQVSASDFAGGVLPSGTVSFGGGQTQGSISFASHGDNVVELGEHFRVELYGASVGYVVDSAAGVASGTLQNDDTGVRISDVSAREGDSADVTAYTFTVTRYGDTSKAASVDWTKFNGDLASSDFVNADGSALSGALGATLNFAADPLLMTDGYGVQSEFVTDGVQSEFVTVYVKGNDMPEADKHFNVRLSNLVGVNDLTTSDTQGVATVQNDDTVFSVAATTPGVTDTQVEGDGSSYSFTISRNLSTQQSETVNWSVIGAGGRSVVDAADFGGTLPSGSVVFAPGELSKVISVSGSSTDGTPEADERFTVQLSLGTGAEHDTVGGSAAVGVVRNDDAAIFISDTQPQVQAEGTGGTTYYSFDVVSTGGTGSRTVHWAVVSESGDTIATSDFFGSPAALPSGDLTLAPDSTTTVQLQLDANSALQPDRNFHIVLTGDGGIVSTASDVLATIADDDFKLEFDGANVTTLAEGDATHTFSLRVNCLGLGADAGSFAPKTLALPTTVSWQLLDMNGDPLTSLHLPVTSGSFDIPAGFDGYSLPIRVVGDQLLQLDEHFQVQLSYNGGQTVTTPVTLTNDDEQFALTPTGPATNLDTVEGDTAPENWIHFTITRSGDASGTSSVDWAFAVPDGAAHGVAAGNFADEAMPQGTVNFANGQTFAAIAVAIYGNQAWDYDRAFQITLSNNSDGSSISDTHASMSGAILNDDQGFIIAADKATVLEGDTGTAVTYTVTRTGGTAESTVHWLLSDPNGQTSGASGDLTFADGVMSMPISVNVTGDTTAEFGADHVTPLLSALTVTLSAPRDGSVVTASATTTVQDDDDILTLTALTPVAQAEGSNILSGYTEVSFVIDRSGWLGRAGTATWTLAGSGSHAATVDPSAASPDILGVVDSDGNALTYNIASNGSLSGTVSFGIGDANTQMIKVLVAADSIGEFDENFTLALSAASTGTTLAAKDYGTATATTPATSASLSHTIGGDDAALAISMTNTSITEGNDLRDTAFTFTVTRTGSTAGLASVNWSVAADPLAEAGYKVDALDFGGFFPGGVVTFADGEATKTVTLLTGGDNVYENNESFVIGLSGASNATIINGSVGAVLVNDDVGVGIAAKNDSAPEGNSGTVWQEFDLSAIGPLVAKTATVHWHVEGESLYPLLASGFEAGQDRLGSYGGMPSGATDVTLANGVGSKAIYVGVLGNNYFAPDAQFKVVIDEVTAKDSTGAALGASATDGHSSASMTMLGDDTLIGLHGTMQVVDSTGLHAPDVAGNQVYEGDSGSKELRFYVEDLGSTLNSPTLDHITVNYHVTGDVDGTDFVSGALTGVSALGHDDNGYYVALQVRGDTTVESTERFTLHLDGANQTGSTGGAQVDVGHNAASATVLTDDVGLEMICPSLSQYENGGRFVFDVLRTGAIGEALDATYRVGSTNGDGVSANDFIDPATGQPFVTGNSTTDNVVDGRFIVGTVHFDAGQTSARFTLAVASDSTPENNENFAVALHTDNSYYHGGDVYQYGTILNDDDGPVVADPLHPQLDVIAHGPV